jgi:hypothetical protein
MPEVGRGGSAALKIAAVLVGLGGALVAAFFMLMGPWISTPSPAGVVLLASVAYPLLLGASAFIAVASLRAALGAAVLAVLSAGLVLWRYRGDEPLGDLFWFGVIIAAPALVQTLLTGIGAMFAGERPLR